MYATVLLQSGIFLFKSSFSDYQEIEATKGHFPLGNLF